jgi:hypothetical protein
MSSGLLNSTDISQCGLYTYLGGYQLGTPSTVMAKTFKKLPAHFAIQIQMLMIMIDSLAVSFDYQLTVDSIVYNNTVNISGTKTN